MRIDSHQHFWNYSAAEYPWIGKGTPLERDWRPADLEREAAKVHIDGSVVVQARTTVEESRWLLKLADAHPFIRGVVGWVDLQSDKVEEDLGPLSKHKKFVGVRHVVQSETADFMLKPEFVSGLGKLKQFNLAYDLLLFPKHLPAAVKVVQELPGQRFVLDHLAKPMIRAGLIQPWKEDLKELARHKNVCCKISGMVTEGKLKGWKKEDFRPYLDVVFEAFGEDRVMFGSDWPVCLLAGTYEEVHGLAADYFDQFSPEVREKFFGGNAAKFYQLPA
ncbi:MAG TPA: amidohydrolase family protein [Methylomirabilota bacterium]|nr:amidohydrolase family protein [Methylomirabilota bacterium]